MVPAPLRTFRATWGLLREDDGYLSLSEFMQELVREQYSGVECSVSTAYRQANFSHLLRQHQLYWIPIVFTSGPIDGCDPFIDDDIRAGPGSNWQLQFQAWMCQMERILELGLDDRIVLVNSFSGHDSMEFEGGVQLFNSMHDWYQSSWVPRLSLSANQPYPEILHETHRGRLLYSPWVTRRYLQAVPELYLVADLSHWTCVSEFDDDPNSGSNPDRIQRNLLHELIQAIAPRVRHVQGRVGYAQGPQVPDPRDSRWNRQLRLFESWWDLFLIHQARQPDGNQSMATFTPEHGPWPYQHQINGLSDRDLLLHVNDINHFLAQRQKQRYQEANKLSIRPPC